MRYPDPKTVLCEASLAHAIEEHLEVAALGCYGDITVTFPKRSMWLKIPPEPDHEGYYWFLQRYKAKEDEGPITIVSLIHFVYGCCRSFDGRLRDVSEYEPEEDETVLWLPLAEQIVGSGRRPLMAKDEKFPL